MLIDWIKKEMPSGEDWAIRAICARTIKRAYSHFDCEGIILSLPDEARFYEVRNPLPRQMKDCGVSAEKWQQIIDLVKGDNSTQYSWILLVHTKPVYPQPYTVVHAIDSMWLCQYKKTDIALVWESRDMATPETVQMELLQNMTPVAVFDLAD